MPPRSSQVSTSPTTTASHGPKGITKKPKSKKADKEGKPPRPKVLEREAKKEAVKQRKAEKAQKILDDIEAGITKKVVPKRHADKEKSKKLNKDRDTKGAMYASGDE